MSSTNIHRRAPAAPKRSVGGPRAKALDPSVIRLRGVRQNNLKNFDLDLPVKKLIVITGLSGSGKSSLAFDTLFAEGQRRYIETFSPYARQFLDRMDKPQVDRIEGIPPAIAIEQRNSVKSTRSTVGTLTELCDYAKLFWPHLAQLHCRQCGRPVRKDSPSAVWEATRRDHPGTEVIITFQLPLSEKLSLAESLALISKQGYQRLLVDGQVLRLEAAAKVLSSAAGQGREAFSDRGCAGVGDKPQRLHSDQRHAESTVADPVNPSKPHPAAPPLISSPTHLTVIQDRLKVAPSTRARFIEACEQAYHFGKGKLTLYAVGQISDLPVPASSRGESHSALCTLHSAFSNRLHCAHCDLEYRDPTPALFSFNHPVGACPACHGFGRIIAINYDAAIPDRCKTLAAGAVRPWQTGVSAECQDDLKKFCQLRGVPMDVPFDQLSRKWQDWVINGDPGYGQDKAHQWPRAWYGVKGYFRWLESKSYKMHVRVLLSRYRIYTTCPDCHGARFQPETLLYRIAITPDIGHERTAGVCGVGAPPAARVDVKTQGVVRSSMHSAAAAACPPPLQSRDPHTSLTLADFYQLPVTQALAFIDSLISRRAHTDVSTPITPASGKVPHDFAPTILLSSDPISLALGEVQSRLRYLEEVGLGYLTLDRPTRSLSGGETERVNLTTCLGSRLVNTLFVLDEPSVGLHPRDTARLVRILERLRDAGNTVVVVEHEAAVIRAADQIIDLGPGHGETGGEVVFQGTLKEIAHSPRSLTGAYLSGRKHIAIPQRRPVTAHSPALTIHHARQHNLHDLTIRIPLGRFVCLTGVSGSGKTTLLRDVLLPAFEAKLKASAPRSSPHAPRSTSSADPNDDSPSTINAQPSTSLTGHESISQVILVDQSPLGRTPRSNPAVYIGAFDDIREVFAQTDAARQHGFSASAFSFNSAQGQCERCRGAGFEKIEMQFLSDVFIRCPECDGRRYRPHILEVRVSEGRRHWSIADLLEATVDEVIGFLAKFVDSKPASRAVASLAYLQEVGLGYLRLGQPINTLSGGESQRLKLVTHLAQAANPPSFGSFKSLKSLPENPSRTLYLFDEPTTGLHFEDISLLLKSFQKLVDAGNSVLVIEHNLDVIKFADWVLDLGPDSGENGGKLVGAGTPESIAAIQGNFTGLYLRQVLNIK